jgi:predicted dithiol-disulfide oxidoreductase (DUF899 family)
VEQVSAKEGDEVAGHKIGTRAEWLAARDELAKLEAEHAERNEEIKRKRLEIPWVPVAKEYVFDTDEGKKTLAEVFDGRSQLLASTSCSGRISRPARAPAARAWRTGSTAS